MNLEKEIIKKENLRKSNQESKELTRRYIRTALLYLMKELPFEKISVTAIINRAGVSRAGFYRNYTGKEDVLNDISNSLYEKLAIYYTEKLCPLEPYQRYTKLFEKITVHADWFKLLLISQFKKNNIFDFDSFIKQNILLNTPEDHYRYIGISYAQRFIIRDWFQNGMKESPEKMAAIFCSLFE